MREPTVAVIAFPHLYTSLIARVLRARGGYAVEAPDVVSDAWQPAAPFDAVVTSLPVPRSWGRVLVELPDDFEHPVKISVGDLTVQIDVDPENPLEDVLALLDLALAPGLDAATERLLAPADAEPRPTGGEDAPHH